jgi:tripartite-type tricarboxylate transporter receptor subunit TctC
VKKLALVLGVLLAAFQAAAAPASEQGTIQDWPGKTVRIVVPFGAGSTPDIVARLIADSLKQKYPNSAFVVENKPGASGNIGTDAVAKADPDGTTLGVSIGGPLAINTLLFAALPYDPQKDIAAVTQLVTMPSVLAVTPNLGVNSVGDLVALLKRDPGKYDFGSIGNGSLSHLSMEAIALKAAPRSCTFPLTARRRR